VLGTIACGEPILAEQNISEYVYESPERLPAGELFYLRAKGKSMEPTIPDGSLVLIREQPHVENGAVAAVLVNGDEEATLKRVKRQADLLILLPDNPEYEPIIVTPDNPARIIGRAVQVVTML
jgi:repressor LexA